MNLKNKVTFSDRAKHKKQNQTTNKQTNKKQDEPSTKGYLSVERQVRISWAHRMENLPLSCPFCTKKESHFNIIQEK